MADALLILHFLGLMLATSGIVGAVASLAAMRPAARGKTGGRGPGRLYARIATVGVVVLLPSGIGLLVVKPWLFYPGAMFWMKVVFAVALALSVVGMEMVHAGRSKQAGGLLASVAPLAGLSLLAGVVFSVLSFH